MNIRASLKGNLEPITPVMSLVQDPISVFSFYFLDAQQLLIRMDSHAHKPGDLFDVGLSPFCQLFFSHIVSHIGSHIGFGLIFLTRLIKTHRDLQNKRV